MVGSAAAASIRTWARLEVLLFRELSQVFTICRKACAVEAVRRVLGPSGGAFIRDKVEGKVPTLLGYSLWTARSPRMAKFSLTLADGRAHARYQPNM